MEKFKVNKKILISLLIIVVILLIMAFFVKKEGEDFPITQSIPKPIIPNPIETGFQIQSKLDEKDFPADKSASLLIRERTSAFTETEARDIASKMGFSGEPIVIDDTFAGLTYFWKNVPESLFVYSGTRTITYNYNQYEPVPNKQLSDAAIKKAAEDFLAENSLFNIDELSFSFFTFLSKPTGDAHGLTFSSKEDASIFIVNFISAETSVKLITLDPRSSPISVWVLPNGQITKSEISKLGKLSISKDKHALKNYTEFITTLKEAVLISLDDGNILLHDVTNSVRKIEVSGVELVYYTESNEAEVFQPIFLLKGEASVAGFPEDVSAVLYLPAIKNP